eukprot:2355252-Lingulodinium_polyedra.AAC.1
MYAEQLKAFGQRVDLECPQSLDLRQVPLVDVLAERFNRDRTDWLARHLICILGLLMDRGTNKQGFSTDLFVARRIVRARSRRDEIGS